MTVAQVIALVLLGAVHGAHPGMGWMFAVSSGVQQRSRRALVRSLPFIGLGHEGAVAVVLGVLIASASLLLSKVIVVLAGLVLLAFGLVQLRRRRGRELAAAGLSRWRLAGWSFVMSSAHGAGLMLLPVLIFPIDGYDSAFDLSRGLSAVLVSALLTLLVHSAAMLLSCALVALVVHGAVGARMARSRLDPGRLWGYALVGAGAATLLSLA